MSDTTQSEQATGNWGRWGEDDERGALNLIRPESVATAAHDVQLGRVFNLGLPVQHEGVPVFEYRGAPHRLTLTSQTDVDMFKPYGGPDGLGANEDVLVIAAHNGTHMDALCHVFSDNLLYNGFPTSVVNSSKGASRLGIDKTAGFAARMVLLDVAGYQGTRWLEPGTPIGADDLEACRAAQDVELHPGDVLLVRTGWLDLFASLAPGEAPPFEQPGLNLSSVDFIRDHEVAAVGADNAAVEVMPFDEERFLSVHVELLVKLGVTLFEHLVLTPLAKEKHFTGLFVVAPLLVTGGSGSPVNPIVIV